MIYFSRISGQTALVSVAALLLSSCSSSRLNPDTAQRINETLTNREQGIPTRYDSSPEKKEQVKRLWRDKPEYAAIVDNEKHLNELRIISAAVPRYPYMLRRSHAEADVTVSYIVGLDGRIEDARILESSDSRFDAYALEAVRQFTFIPAEGPAGPERALVWEPFHFRVRKPGSESTAP
jgi:TonB family protein